MEIKKVSVTQVLSDGFKKTFHNFLACLKGLFGLSLIGSLGVIAAILVNIPLVMKLISQPVAFWEQVRACGDNVVCFKTLLWPLFQSNVVVLVLSFIFLGLFWACLMLGYTRYNLNVQDKGGASLKDLCMPLGKTVRYILTLVLFASICFGGLLLLVLPGIYWATRFSQFAYFIIDKDAGIIESLKMSWAATAGNFWPIFFTLFVIGMFSLVGNMFILFLIVTMPLASIISACLYRSLTSDHGKSDGQPFDKAQG